MKSSFGHQNITNETYFDGKSVQQSNDTTLPFQMNRFVANNYEYKQETTIIPASDTQVYESGTGTPIRYCVATPQNMALSPFESDFTYKLAIGASNAPLTKTDAINETYCQIAGLTAPTFTMTANTSTGAVTSSVTGAVTAVGTTLKMIYIKNSNSV